MMEWIHSSRGKVNPGGCQGKLTTPVLNLGLCVNKKKINNEPFIQFRLVCRSVQTYRKDRHGRIVLSISNYFDQRKL